MAIIYLTEQGSKLSKTSKRLVIEKDGQTQITYEMEAPQIIEMIQKLLDDIYKNEGKKMPKMSQFPNNLKSIKVEFN